MSRSEYTYGYMDDYGTSALAHNARDPAVFPLSHYGVVTYRRDVETRRRPVPPAGEAPATVLATVGLPLARLEAEPVFW